MIAVGARARRKPPRRAPVKRPASFVKRLLLERIAEKEAVLARSGGPLAAALHAPRVVEAALEAVLKWWSKRWSNR